MSTDRTRRFLLEFVAIFGGVTLGLLAEDWRQSRIDRRDAQEALELIAADLLADSLWMTGSRSALERHVRSAAWLQEYWSEATVDPDSLSQALWGFLWVEAPQFRRVAYASLQDGDRLGLIEDDSLRLGIIEYYEYWQAEAHFYTEGNYGQRQIWYDDIITDHALLPPGREPGTVWPPEIGPLRVTSSWRQIRADNLVHNHATAVAMWAQIALERMDDAHARISALRSRISQTLH